MTDILELSRSYLAANAAETGADVLIEEMAKEIKRLRSVLTNIVACTHRPNPTDPSRIDVAPGKHRRFQGAIEDARSALQ